MCYVYAVRFANKKNYFHSYSSMNKWMLKYVERQADWGMSTKGITRDL